MTAPPTPGPTPAPTPDPWLRRWLRRLTAGTTTAGLLALAVPAATGPTTPAPDPAAPTHDTAASGVPESAAPALALVGHNKPHPHRRIKKYRVRRGDTPSEIAVRYHAWTAQLLRINHTSTLYAGQVILVPVVVRAARECTKHEHHRTNLQRRGGGAEPDRGPKASKPHKPKADKPRKPRKPKPQQRPGKHTATNHKRGWHHAGASRTVVRRVIVQKAKRHGVAPNLALAIAWQESGWQQKRVSSAGALGAMQIMPATGRWMSLVAGRRLNPRDLHHNATAGTMLIRQLRREARVRTAVAGYYQGLGGVREHGMYPSTKRYVANVLSLKQRLAEGWSPI